MLATLQRNRSVLGVGAAAAASSRGGVIAHRLASQSLSSTNALVASAGGPSSRHVSQSALIGAAATLPRQPAPITITHACSHPNHSSRPLPSCARHPALAVARGRGRALGLPDTLLHTHARSIHAHMGGRASAKNHAGGGGHGNRKPSSSGKPSGAFPAPDLQTAQASVSSRLFAVGGASPPPPPPPAAVVAPPPSSSSSSSVSPQSSAAQSSSTPVKPVQKPAKMVEIFRGMSAELLAQRLRVPFKQLQPVLQLLADEDADVSPASALSIETAELAALEYEFDAKIVSPPSKKAPVPPQNAATQHQQQHQQRQFPPHQRRGAQPPPPPPPTRAPAMPTNPSRKPRPPVVTIMGHVDHGKTTLLDSLRKTSVAAGEAGGITQHIGAFKVPLPNGGAATFLDTPGHAAFSAMRSRGARATDIVILVVAADDGVMPQTVESIEHIRASRAPMIVAVTKCDMPMSNPKNVYQQLLKHGVHVEALGGSVQSVELAAPKGLGLSDLIENIAALTEQIAPEAEQDGPAEAIAIESKQREGMGMVVTCLVTQGILREGAILVSGTAFARVRRLSNDRGEAASEAFPSDPVEVVGWKHVVELGGHIVEVPSEDRAKRLVSVRASKKQSQQTSQAPNLASEGFSDQMSREDRRLRSVRLASHGRIVVAKRGIDAEATQHNVKEAEAAARAEPVSLNIVLKADVVGSMEAIAACLAGLPQSQVRVSVVRQDIGAITQSDIDIAAASDGVIITFSQPAPSKAIDTKARAAGVDIRSYNIIYKLLDDMKELMRSRLPSRTVEKTLGTANVLACFPHSRVPGLIAGVRVQTGSMLRKHNFSVTRKGQVIFSGKAVALRHVKQDVETLDRGGEGGLQLEKFGPFEIGDEIRCFELKEERPEIEEY